jgi:excinuclease UvrABC ATPase subunit
MTHSDDFIRVHGARENNLKNINVETPKRGLTVFTGVSGSGKCSLVFATIAGESQRLINKTYSAFVQGGLHAEAAAAHGRARGADYRDHVDQQAADGRRPPHDSWHRHRTDASPMLRILFGRLR